MTVDEVQKLTNHKYKLHLGGTDFSPGPTSRQMEEEEFYYIDNEEDGLILSFNYYYKLVGIQRFKWFGVDPNSVRERFYEWKLERRRGGVESHTKTNT